LPSDADAPVGARTGIGYAVEIAGAIGLPTAASLLHLSNSLLVTVYPGGTPRLPLLDALAALAGWLLFALSVWLIGPRTPHLGLGGALHATAIARAAMLPQALFAWLLGFQIAKVKVDIEAAFPLKLSSITPTAWALMGFYALSVMFAVWAHAEAYRAGRGRDRLQTMWFLCAFGAAAAAQYVVVAMVRGLVG